MTKKIISILTILLVATCVFCNLNEKIGYADELSDSIEEQMGNIDLSEIENFFDENGGFDNKTFLEYVKEMLNGKYQAEYDNVGKRITSILFSEVNKLLPSLVSITLIAIFCGIFQGMRSSFASDGVANLISFVGLLAVILIISLEISSLWKDCENIIKNIANLSTIMSPIITTLMVAGGAKVSASLYSPTVTVLSNLIINVLLGIALPLIAIMIIFSIISNFSSSVKLSKFTDLASSIIKWTLGITATVFTVFLSVQGITSATYDGISVKAAKYAISNSIPLVGGFLRDGFDLVLAGSVLIKNSVGLACIFGVINLILSPVIKMTIFSLILKTCSAVTEPISDGRISNFCTSIAKCVNYLLAVTLVVGLMFFITILLMIFSASVFI